MKQRTSAQAAILVWGDNMQGGPVHVAHYSPCALHKEIVCPIFGNQWWNFSSQFNYLFRERLEITVRVSLGNIFLSLSWFEILNFSQKTRIQEGFEPFSGGNMNALTKHVRMEQGQENIPPEEIQRASAK